MGSGKTFEGVAVMTLKDQARLYIKNMTNGRIRKLTRDRILGADIYSVFYGCGFGDDEPSEELIIQLLRDSELPGNVREAIMKGCGDIYAKIVDWMILGEFNDNRLRNARAKNSSDVFIRFCWIIDIVSPPELENYARCLMATLMNQSRNVNICPGILQAAMRAYCGYTNAIDISFLKSLLRVPNLSAYAFSALLSIDPMSSNIEKALKTLWYNQMVFDWPIDAAFLARRAARLRGSDAIIKKVLTALRKDSREKVVCNWRKLENELERREWSRAWLEFIKKR